MSVTITLKGARELRRKLVGLTHVEEESLRKETRRALVNIESGAKQRAGSKSGQLRTSITHEIDSDGFGGRAGTNNEHAEVHHFGSKAHTIRPRRKRALRFKVKGGQVVFAKRVRHPGTKANPFLFNAYEEERPKHVRRLARALDEAHWRVARR